jgi:transketolase
MSMDSDTQDLDLVATRVAIGVVLMAYNCGDAHLSSSLSVVDALTASFEFIRNDNNSRDNKIILSKGHAAAALYSTMSEFGLLEKESLKTFNLPGTKLGNHPSRFQLPQIEYSSGSLGHGLSLAAGIAMGYKFRKNKSSVLAILGDGELNEGSVWEGAMFAANNKLNNLIALIDHNKIQAVAHYEEVAGNTVIKDKFNSFGWESIEMDGHNPRKILDEISKHHKDESRNKPLAIILNTISGARVSIMENAVLWHYKKPNREEFEIAMRELNASKLASDLLDVFK